MRHWLGEQSVEQREAADVQQLEILKQGAHAWNQWRKDNSDVSPVLNDADLKGADLSKCNLQTSEMNGIDLSNANLSLTNLSKSSLKEAILFGAKLDRANLTGAILEDADLRMVTAKNAIFSTTQAHGANLSGAIIQESQLGRADMIDTDLREAEFQNSDLRRVKMEGAILWTTHLDGADLRGATGMKFDDTIIKDTIFSPRSPDRWSTLRRYYTGPRYAITLILLIAFILPYFTKAAGWVAAAKAQESMESFVDDIETGLLNSTQVDAANTAIAEELIKSIRHKLPVPGNQEWEQAQVWELLLGVDKGPWYFFSTCMLILYNLFRGMLTWVVGPMRDAEERSGVSPQHRVDAPGRGKKIRLWMQGGWAETYAWLWMPHRIVSFLYVVAVGSFLLHAVNWLSLEVWLPQ